MVYHRFFCLVAAGCFLASAASAAEYAVLYTGFRLRIERHELRGDRARLFTAQGGTIELPVSTIQRFERDDYAPPPALPEKSSEPEPESLDTAIERFAAEMELPPALVHSVIAAESAYNPNAVSPKGAVGLMQLMPQTARELNVEDSSDPEQNVRGGSTYLKRLLDRYAGAPDQLLRALAAYNAGPAKVTLHGGLPPYDETRLFVRRVLDRFLKLTETNSGHNP